MLPPLLRSCGIPPQPLAARCFQTLLLMRRADPNSTDLLTSTRPYSPPRSESSQPKILQDPKCADAQRNRRQAAVGAPLSDHVRRKLCVGQAIEHGKIQRECHHESVGKTDVRKDVIEASWAERMIFHLVLQTDFSVVCKFLETRLKSGFM